MPSAVGDRAWVSRWRPLANDEAAEHTKLATDALPTSEEATGGEAAQKARELLEADPPSSKNAAKALMQIGAHDVENKDHINNPKLNELRARLRDAVAMSVRAEAEKPKDENSYQQVLDGAFGDRLDRKLRAVIMLAYHKLMSSDGVDKPDKFKSRAQRCNERRTVPRPKRERHKQSSGGGDARPALTKAPVPEPKAPSGGTVAAPAWQREPRFVPMTTRQNPNRPRKVAPYDPTLSAVQEKSISDAEDDACANAADAIPVARPVGVERAADFGNYHWVEDPEEARNHIQGVWQDLFSTWETSIMAVDVGYHLGMVYHVQLATQERTIVLNAWKLKDSMHELLQPLLEAPWVSKIFHGASKHIFLLNFSYDIMVKGQIFDLAAPSELPQLITLKDTIQKSRSWEQKWWQDPC